VVWCCVAMAFGQEPPPPEADPGRGSVSFNDDFELRYWTTDDRLPDPSDVPVLNYVEQVNRLNANATAGRWTFAAQLDQVALFADRYYLDDVLVLERDLTSDGLPNVFPGRLADTAYINLEKLRATVEGDWGSLSLGDNYVAFGRGMALNLNRNVDIDIDTSIQGSKAVFRPGAWDVTLVAGQANRQQVYQDNPNLQIEGDRRHLIAGARAERFGLGPMNLGAHGVVYDFVEETGWGPSLSTLDPFDAVVGGVTAEIVGLGGIDAYVEGDLYAYGPNQPSPPESGSNLGSALYASASAYPGPFVVLLEGKRYQEAERLNRPLATELYEVAVAPTLEYERAVTEDSSEALNSNDVYGGRIQVDWAAIPGKLVPNVAVATFRDADLELHNNTVPETVLHPTIGVEWIDGELAVLANAGYRVDDRDGTELGADRQLHGDLSMNFPLPGEFLGYVSAYGEWFRSGTNAFESVEYVEAETGYSLVWRSLAATLFVDTSTNPIVTLARPGNVTDTLFTSAELQVKPAQSWTIKALYGAQKAGIRCSGGQCRQLPGFEGARLSVVGSF
jgi:hypothetical protein